jgi:DNA-binding ferritin-like protein
MTTALQLTQVFNDNFVAYFRSHVAHVNIVGRNFQSDHTLLGTIYEDLQAQIDTLGELLRSIQEFMPDDIYGVLDTSEITTDAINGKADVLLSRVYDDLVALKDCYEELMTVADEEGHKEIANYAQDRILTLAKFIWMLSSTLED